MFACFSTIDIIYVYGWKVGDECRIYTSVNNDAKADNGLSIVRHQAIVDNNAGILHVMPLGNELIQNREYRLQNMCYLSRP